MHIRCQEPAGFQYCDDDLTLSTTPTFSLGSLRNTRRKQVSEITEPIQTPSLTSSPSSNKTVLQSVLPPKQQQHKHFVSPTRSLSPLQNEFTNTIPTADELKVLYRHNLLRAAMASRRLPTTTPQIPLMPLALESALMHNLATSRQSNSTGINNQYPATHLLNAGASKKRSLSPMAWPSMPSQRYPSNDSLASSVFSSEEDFEQGSPKRRRMQLQPQQQKHLLEGRTSPPSLLQGHKIQQTTNNAEASKEKIKLDEDYCAMRKRANFERMDHTMSALYRWNKKTALFRSDKVLLPEDFEPSGHSVLLGHKKNFRNSPGNLRLKALCAKHKSAYDTADREGKSDIVTTILTAVYEQCPTGAFLRFKDGRFYEVEDLLARDKIASDLRNLLPSKYRSAHKNRHTASATITPTLETATVSMDASTTSADES